MNQELFAKYMKRGHRPSQNGPEYRQFLEICEAYLIKHGIKKPVAVELGIWRNRQKKFYEELLGAEHICIDVKDTRGLPDILGNTHDPHTIKILRKKLKGRPINILFIDAGHAYEDVKKDFELYSPLCPDIIALHDTDCHRYSGRDDMQVWRFWDELKLKAYEGDEELRNYLFIQLFQHRSMGNGVQMGIGLIIKR